MKSDKKKDCCAVYFQTKEILEQKKLEKIYVSKNNNLILSTNELSHIQSTEFLVCMLLNKREDGIKKFDELSKKLFKDKINIVLTNKFLSTDINFINTIRQNKKFKQHKYYEFLPLFFEKCSRNKIIQTNLELSELIMRAYYTYFDLKIVFEFTKNFYIIDNETKIINIDDIINTQFSTKQANVNGNMSFHCESKLALTLDLDNQCYIGISKLACPLCMYVLDCFRINYRGSHASLRNSLSSWSFLNILKKGNLNCINCFTCWLENIELAKHKICNFKENRKIDENFNFRQKSFSQVNSKENGNSSDDFEVVKNEETDVYLYELIETYNRLILPIKNEIEEFFSKTNKDLCNKFGRRDYFKFPNIKIKEY